MHACTYGRTMQVVMSLSQLKTVDGLGLELRIFNLTHQKRFEAKVDPRSLFKIRLKWLQIASFLMVWSYNWEYSIWPTKTEVFSKSCWNDLKLHICWWFWDRIENVWPTQNRSKAFFDLNMLEWLQISSIFWHDFVSTFQVNFGLFLRLDWIFSILTKPSTNIQFEIMFMKWPLRLTLAYDLFLGVKLNILNSNPKPFTNIQFYFKSLLDFDMIL